VIFDSLVIKKRVIEIDEYDVDYRNIMNYGHTFGHALESVTNYSIPHGVAVTWGIGLANFVSNRLGLLSQDDMEKMETLVLDNSKNISTQIENMDFFWNALKKDKKNIDSNINFILTKGFGKMFKKRLPLDEQTKGFILQYLGKHNFLKGEG
jgi:3-dehydroquinate synthase